MNDRCSRLDRGGEQTIAARGQGKTRQLTCHFLRGGKLVRRWMCASPDEKMLGGGDGDHLGSEKKRPGLLINGGV